jgi:hypothetical protein
MRTLLPITVNSCIRNRMYSVLAKMSSQTLPSIQTLENDKISATILATVSETSSREGLRYNTQSCDCCCSYFEHTGRISWVSELDASRIDCRRTQGGFDFRSVNRKLYESQNRGIFQDVFSTRSTLLEAAMSRRRRREVVKYITPASTVEKKWREILQTAVDGCQGRGWERYYWLVNTAVYGSQRVWMVRGELSVSTQSLM